MADGIFGSHHVGIKLHDDLFDYVLLENRRTNDNGYLVGD
jgi:hypothetical protein